MCGLFLFATVIIFGFMTYYIINIFSSLNGSDLEEADRVIQEWLIVSLMQSIYSLSKVTQMKVRHVAWLTGTLGWPNSISESILSVTFGKQLSNIILQNKF